MIYTSMFNSPLGGSEPAASPGSARRRHRPTCHPPSPSLPPPTAPPSPRQPMSPSPPPRTNRTAASRTSNSSMAPPRLAMIPPAHIVLRPASPPAARSEEHTSELQSLRHLV